MRKENDCRRQNRSQANSVERAVLKIFPSGHTELKRLDLCDTGSRGRAFSASRVPLSFLTLPTGTALDSLALCGNSLTWRSHFCFLTRDSGHNSISPRFGVPPPLWISFLRLFTFDS